VEQGIFTDETLSAMGKAFTAALRSLGIGDDEIKRAAVARVIIGLAREDGNLDAASLYNRLSRLSAARSVSCNSPFSKRKRFYH
jgi:hypothetical protein